MKAEKRLKKKYLQSLIDKANNEVTEKVRAAHKRAVRGNR